MEANRRNYRHAWIFLTKRPERVIDWMAWAKGTMGMASQAAWFLHKAWLGVTVESNDQTFRLDHLKNIHTAVRFVSVEPMLTLVDIERHLDWLNWVICGGESGPGARPMHPDWVRSLRDQCVDAGTPFFFKQCGEWRESEITDKEYNRDGCKTERPVQYLEPTKYRDKALPTEMLKVGKKAAGRELDGRTWDQYPAGEE